METAACLMNQQTRRKESGLKCRILMFQIGLTVLYPNQHIYHVVGFLPSGREMSQGGNHKCRWEGSETVGGAGVVLA